MGNALHTKGNTPGVGVTDAGEARLDDAGLLAIGSGGLISARTGVMHGPGAAALVSGTSATAPMQYQVAAHHWVTSRGVVSDGVYRGAAEAAKLVDTTAAPGSGSRIDVVWVKQLDAGSTISPDSSSAPQYGCTQGTPTTGTPTKPTIPTGAEELATAVVPAGTTRTNSGVTISQTARLTVARGAAVPVRTKDERDNLPKYAGLRCLRLDLGGVEEWCDGTTWRGTMPQAPVTAATNATPVNTTQLDSWAVVNVADPGVPFRVRARASVPIATNTCVADTRIRVGSTSLAAGTEPVVSAVASSYQINGDVCVHPGFASAVITGPARIVGHALRTSGTGNWQIGSPPQLEYEVIPA